MPILSGNISGSIRSVALSVPAKIKWLSVVNKSGGSALVNLGIIVSGVEIWFKTINLTSDGSSDEKVDINVLAGSQILIIANASVDFYFSIE